MLVAGSALKSISDSNGFLEEINEIKNVNHKDDEGYVKSVNSLASNLDIFNAITSEAREFQDLKNLIGNTISRK